MTAKLKKEKRFQRFSLNKGKYSLKAVPKISKNSIQVNQPEERASEKKKISKNYYLLK
jgi:hypothetical protein